MKFKNRSDVKCNESKTLVKCPVYVNKPGILTMINLAVKTLQPPVCWIKKPVIRYGRTY